MGKINSYRKGSAYERKIAKILAEAFDCDVRRVPHSGALDYLKGDVYNISEKETPLEDYTIECKKVERINIHKCLEQAVKEGEIMGKIPLLIFSRNRSPDYISLRLDHFIDILKGRKNDK